MNGTKKIITAGLAAATLIGGLATATGASAQRYHGGYYRHDGGGAAVAAGITGLALGAAIASSGPHYYYGGPRYAYAPYYAYPAYYGGRTCVYWHHDRWGRAYRTTGWC